MNETDPDARPESESSGETARAAASTGREYLSKGAPHLRRGVESGAVAAIVGGVGLLGGLRGLLGGERKRGLAKLAVGATFLGAALAQRRFRGGGASDVEETDVVDSGPDVDAVADETGGVGEDDHATDEAAAEVTDTSPDIEDAASETEAESDADADADAGAGSVDQRDVAGTGVDSDAMAEETDGEADDAGDEDGTSDQTTADAGNAGAGESAGTEDVDRLGEAAFDGQSREVPAPQRAFNQGFLAHSAEAFWGIRDSDDAVFVSQDYDAVEGRDGVQYVASSEIGEDVRELPIPDAILDHWNEVIGGGTAVAGGDDVLFVTTDDLEDDYLLRVLPAEQADDVSG